MGEKEKKGIMLGVREKGQRGRRGKMKKAGVRLGEVRRREIFKGEERRGTTGLPSEIQNKIYISQFALL